MSGTMHSAKKRERNVSQEEIHVVFLLWNEKQNKNFMKMTFWCCTREKNSCLVWIQFAVIVLPCQCEIRNGMCWIMDHWNRSVIHLLFNATLFTGQHRIVDFSSERRSNREKKCQETYNRINHDWESNKSVQKNNSKMSMYLMHKIDLNLNYTKKKEKEQNRK